MNVVEGSEAVDRGIGIIGGCEALGVELWLMWARNNSTRKTRPCEALESHVYFVGVSLCTTMDIPVTIDAWLFPKINKQFPG